MSPFPSFPFRSSPRGPWSHRSLRLFAILVAVLLLPAGIQAATCPDNDEDGYVVCNDCEVPKGAKCGECNDNNPDINPGAAEFCGDEVDNDCDGSIDFGAGQECMLGFPSGCQEPSQEAPCCLTKSVLVCTADGGGVVCQEPEAGRDTPEPEQAYTDACHDEVDNDCDGVADGEDPSCEPTIGELCNDLDDDYDGLVDEDFDLGGPCTVGTGDCTRSGVMACADEFSSGCSAKPGKPTAENRPGEAVCRDDRDNDCDGLADLEDPGCRADERCDGLDNDGDGLVDEDFPDLGQPCTVGQGICSASGTMICAVDGSTTVCSAVPGLAQIEGPAGATCSDKLDNDCDGAVDGEDPSCASANTLVGCSLPYYRGRKYPGFDSCVGLHQIRYFTNLDLEEHPEAKLSAELLAMAADGEILAAIPVNDRDWARLASRKDKEDWTVESSGRYHKVFAPRPVLHVTLDDGNRKHEAFCSDIPFVELLEPQGEVVASSEGDVTRLFAAIPLVDPHQVKVMVDGVDVFAALGISDTALCTPASPCSGTVTINGRPVTMADMVVQSSPVQLPGINTIDGTFANLGCGEHIFKIQAIKRRWAFPNTPDEQCLIDDLAEKGTSSGLDITIDQPADMAVLAVAPVRVTGHACSGRPIGGVEINGRVYDVSGQLFTPGDGETSGDRYDYDIDGTHFLTDVKADLTAGNEPLGTFDLGSNRLNAMVYDDLGNRAFAASHFAVGQVAMPNLPNSVIADLKSELAAKVQMAAESATQELDNAFVVGMTAQAVQDLFDKRCKEAAAEFINNLQSEIINQEVDRRKVEVSVCSCDPTVRTTITGFTADPNDFSCPVTFENDKIKVRMNLPTVDVKLHMYGRCRVSDPVFDICISKTIVEGNTHAVLSGGHLDFEITEGQLLGTSSPPPATFTPPVASDPPTGDIHASIHCLSTVCDILLSPIALIVNGIAGERLIPVIGFGHAIDVNFEADLGSTAPDPIQLGEIKMDEEEVEGAGQKLSAVLSDVQITPQGLVAGLKATFETTSLDPEVETTPGAVLTPAPIPSLPVTGADEVFVALADDTFNQMFASMAVSGKLKTGCNATGKTLGDLLPADCNTISVGTCSTDDTVSCSRDDQCPGGTCVANALKTAIARGGCVAFQGGDCTSLPLGQRIVCQATANKLADANINSGQSLMFCAKQAIPPRLLIADDPNTSPVETAVRLNDLSVALVLDRDNDGQLDGELSAIYKCLAEGAPLAEDCNIFGACLDLNIETEMLLASRQCANDPAQLCTSDPDCAGVGGSCVDVCDDGDPGFMTRVTAVQPTIRSLGVVCGGAASQGDDEVLAGETGQDTTIDLLLEDANRFTPPACIKGLDLGGFVNFVDPKLISIDTDGDATFDDYLGITGKVQ